jgi:hypothetical protein
VRGGGELSAAFLVDFTSVGPDPLGSAFILVGESGYALGMRIRVQEGKNYPQK